MLDKQYYVYIMANEANKVLYVGVTNDLCRRVAEHKSNAVPGFTSCYQVHKLVYYEAGGDISACIEREKQIKGLLRSKKEGLIRSFNPDWHDLYDEILQ